MIPKRIFYVWGYKEPKSRMTDVCIENWRMMLPDYEIIEINENCKYFDFKYEYDSNLWFKTVYDLKLWAYVADYMRVKVLYDHGGIYFDTDVTVYKDFEPLLEHTMFIGNTKPNLPDPAIFGAVKGNIILKEMLEFYKNDIWSSDIYVITFILKKVLEKYKIKRNNHVIVKSECITIYPTEYFQPFYFNEEFEKECITENTYTVHWQTNSWQTKKNLYFLSNKHKIPLKSLLRQLEFIEKVDPKACKK